MLSRLTALSATPLGPPATAHHARAPTSAKSAPSPYANAPNALPVARLRTAVTPNTLLLGHVHVACGRRGSCSTSRQSTPLWHICIGSAQRADCLLLLKNSNSVASSATMLRKWG